VLADALLQRAAPGVYTVQWTPDYGDGLRRLRGSSADAVLIDYSLGARNGLEFIHDIAGGLASVPMILLTGQGDSRIEAAALAAGATDYLEKGALTGVMLDRSLRYAIGRRRAAAALQVSEERFRAIVENSTEGLALFDADRRILFQSPAVTAILGYAPAAMQGRPFDHFLSHDGIDGHGATFARALRNPGTVVETEVTARHMDGSWRTLACTMVNRLHQPAIRAVVCNYRDVTRRRRAEDATQEAARQFRAVFESANDGMIISDGGGNCVAANPAALALLGTTQGALLKDGLASVSPAVVSGCADACGGAARAAVRPLQLRRPDGTVRDVELRVTHDIRPGQHLAVLRDVTERKAAERRIAEAQDRFAAIFANSPTAMCIFDCAGGRITEVNTQFECLTEYPRQDAIGRSGVDLGLWGAAGADGVRLDGFDLVRPREVRLLRRSGEPRDVLLSVEPLDTHGCHDHLRVALMADVTERNLLEAQLRQSQKMEAIGQLAGGVAHDFNNLLTVILGYAEFLSVRPELPPDAIGDTHEILKACHTAASLTQQLLAFSRRMTFAPGIVDVNELVTSTHGMLTRLISEDIVTEMVLAPSVRPVVADGPALQQALINLVVNARDAMPGGGRLGIETADVVLGADFVALHRGSVMGPHVMIAVSDTGTGMPEDVKAHAFEPFFTTKPRGKGTGLGLSSVYAAVKQSHGSISIDSAPGQGSTFRLYLPVSTVAGAAAVVAEPTTGLAGSEAILLVEDDDAVRELVEAVLSRQGYAVTAAANPKEGLEILSARGPFDMLITDVTMPGMGGREFATRCQEQRPDLRVLFMTGYVEALAEDGVLDPCLAVMQKPFSGAALLARVRSFFDGPCAPGS